MPLLFLSSHFKSNKCSSSHLPICFQAEQAIYDQSFWIKELKYLRAFILTFIPEIFFSSFLSAQNLPGKIDQDESLGNISEFLTTHEAGSNSTEVLEDLEFFRLHPLNLNTASSSDLQKLHLLNDLQIAFLIQQRKLYGAFRIPRELSLIEGFDSTIVRQLLQLTWLGPERQNNLFSLKTLHDSKNELLLQSAIDLPKRKGFIEGKHGTPYAGPMESLYFRWEMRNENIFSAGITAQNDAGEPFFAFPNRSGFDFYSFHIWAKPDKFIESFCIGDYKISTGLGLCLGSGFSILKSAGGISIPFGNNGLSPYRSSGENNFLRGIATVLHQGAFHSTLFVSHKFIDGRLQQADSPDSCYISSLPESGLHRTKGELASRHTTGEWIEGASFSVQNNQLYGGLNFISRQLQYPLYPDSLAYNQYSFRGRNNYNMGGDYHWIGQNLTATGEFGFCESGGIGAIQQLSWVPSEQISFVLVARHYDRNFNSIRGNSFAATSHNRNETGIYGGTEILLSPKIKLCMWLDKFRFPEINYRTSTPTHGSEWLIGSDYSLSRNIAIHFSINQEQKEYNQINEQKVKVLTPTITTRSKINCKIDWSKNRYLKTEIDNCQYKAIKRETGWLFFQDLGWKTHSQKANHWIRVAFFNTPSYNSRIYTYENDLLYVFDIPSFYGRGAHLAINSAFQLSKKTSIEIKASRTQRLDHLSSGSGNNETNSKSIHAIKVQLRIIF